MPSLINEVSTVFETGSGDSLSLCIVRLFAVKRGLQTKLLVLAQLQQNPPVEACPANPEFVDSPNLLFSAGFAILRLAIQATLEQAKISLRVRLYPSGKRSARR
jgi:hypothetical protein